MEKAADRVSRLIKEKLALYHTLHEIFEREKDALREMDLNALWEINAQKKQIVKEIEISERHLISLLRDRSDAPGRDEAHISLAGYIGRLSVSPMTKADLKKMCSGLKVVADKVMTLASSNKRYVNESLAVIDDIFSTITNRKDRNLYNMSGSLNSGYEQKNIIKAEV